MLSMTTALALALQAAPAPPTCPLGVAAGGARVWVYNAPGRGMRKIWKLRAGAPLFVCNANAGWVYILYPDQRHSCPGTANGLDIRYAATCAGGWVPGHQVAVFSRPVAR